MVEPAYEIFSIKRKF